MHCHIRTYYLKVTNLTGTFVCDCRGLCIFLVLNFANPMIFMTVSSQITGIKFCGLRYNSKKVKINTRK